MNIRLDNQLRTYQIDQVGSNYVDELHGLLRLANKLSNEVLSLNPKCEEIGSGKLANVQELAKQFRDRNVI